MSWSIALIKNTLIIPEPAQQRVARALMPTLGAENEDEIINHRFAADGRLVFHQDDMEHMDFLTWDDKACEEIAAAGGQGHVLFGSLEGDNKGQFWGQSSRMASGPVSPRPFRTSCGPKRLNPLRLPRSERSVI